MKSKICKCCQQEKHLGEFYNNSFTLDGKQSWCKTCSAKAGKERRMKNPRQCREYSRKSHKKLKEEVLTHYGNGKLACVKCGFNDIRALSIDHIEGSGAEHRRTLKRLGGKNLYSWFRKTNFPEGYQTLCMNCQWVRRWKEAKENAR